MRLQNLIRRLKKKRTAAIAIPAAIIAALAIAGTTYAVINLTAQKPAQHSALKPGINLDQGEKGLVGWWKLNGNTKDSTPYSNNGTLTGTGVTPTTDRKGTPNGAYAFAGGSNRITLPASAAPNFNVGAGQAMTISVWMKAGSVASTTQALFSHQDGCISWQMSMTTTGTLAMQDSIGTNCSDNHYYTATASGNYADSNWHLVTGVIDRSTGTIAIYVDGTLKTSTAIPTTGNDNEGGNVFYIGNSYLSSLPFTGSLADARIYNRALSQSDVTNLYNSYNAQVNLYSPPGSGNGVNLTAGLVGYWPFNGNANDATPYGDNGTVNGATLTTNRFGTPNTAYAFNGSGDYIAIPSSNFNLTNNFSLAAWIYANPDTNTNYSIISTWRSQDGGQNWWFFRQRSGLSNNLAFQINVSHSQVISTGTPINANTWYYVTFVLNSGVAKLYINGSLAGTLTNFGSILSGNTSGLRIGGTNPTDQSSWFNGSIDDVRVYNRALSQAEVTALYNLPN